MIEVISGKPIGTFSLIVVKELEPTIHETYKERRVKVVCPICNKPFDTDLRRLTKKKNTKKSPVRMCPFCAKKYIAELNKQRGKLQIDDLAGERFGNLVALYPLEKRRNKSVVWHCKCDCGGYKDVTQVDLRRGHTTHCNLCGCNGFGQERNLSGLKFGKLTALYPTDKRKHDSVIWYCSCECGNFCYKSCNDLTRGHAQSCGCLVSKGETLLQSLFTKMEIKFITQKVFDNCINPKTQSKLKFDFFLPDYNTCIEYDGKQHFQYSGSGWDTKKEFLERQYRDNIKNQYCKKYNIRLIRIPYWDYNQIDERYITNLLHSI